MATVWAAVAVVGWLECQAALTRPASDRLPDLDVYRGAVRLLLDSGSLYDFAAPFTGAPFTYPPFAGLLFVPLAAAPAEALRYLWSAATVGVVLLLARHAAALDDSTARPFGGSTARPFGVRTGLVALALLVSAPISSNLRFGQVSVPLAAMVLMDLSSGRAARLRGVLTGLAAGIKLTPLVFVPLLWLGGRRRAAVAALATLAGTVAAGWVVLPGDSTRFWLHELRDVQRIGHITSGGNQSFNGALLRLGLPTQPRELLVLAGGLAVLLVALVRASRLARSGRWPAAAVVVGAAGLVASPVSWTHHQIWLVLAAFVPLAAGTRARVAWTATVLVLMIAPVTSLGAGLPGVAGDLLGEVRLLLAVAVACAVPFAGTRRTDPSAFDLPAAGAPPTGAGPPAGPTGAGQPLAGAGEPLAGAGQPLAGAALPAVRR